MIKSHSTHLYNLFYLAGDFFKEINPNNPLGYTGLLAKQFQRILERIWVKGDKIINPSMIKYLLYEKTKAFSGYGQQDAQEFMNYFLDGLHEVSLCIYMLRSDD